MAGKRASEISVAIIGAGFSGLCMGIQLKKAGITSFTIFEAADDVGGTWRDNSYPGCACDIPSPLYSYSFAQYPYWSELYSGQPEIWQYQKWVVDKYELQPYIKLKTRIASATFEDADGVWHLTSAAGDKFEAKAVVMGVGTCRAGNTPMLLEECPMILFVRRC
jgi:cation diffusion facilitator CzcD-associated flavoprotein CzcO